MAAIRRKCDSVVFTSGNTLAVLDFRTQAVQFLSIPTIKDQNPADEEEEDGKGDKEESPNAPADNTVLASAFSASGSYFAVCDDRKRLHLFDTRPQWTLRDSRPLSRRCISIVFTKDEASVVVGDKCGDVYSFKVSDREKPPQLCLGHLSIVLDVILVHDDRYVVTCDRDEKIRISHFPNAYNIHSFCLGHTEFVSSLVYAKDEDLLISGSGDCTVRVWSLDGKEQCCIKSHVCSKIPAGEQSEEQTDQAAIEKIVYSNRRKLLAVSVGRRASVEIYKLLVADFKVTLNLLQTLTFSIDPWDIVFDDLDLLWVLLPVESACLKVYELKEDKESHRTTVSEVCDNNHVEACTQTMNKHWQFFKVSIEKPNVLPSLWKQKIDNVSDYLQRKQQRLKGDANGEELLKVKTVIPEKKIKAS